jgi:hypothetical protein
MQKSPNKPVRYSNVDGPAGKAYFFINFRETDDLGIIWLKRQYLTLAEDHE